MVRMQDNSNETSDPVSLAREVVRGRSLKRGDLNEMLRGLIKEVEELRRPSSIETTTPEPIEVELVDVVDLPKLGPAAKAMLKDVRKVAVKSPVKVEITPTGAIYLGKEANRTYTLEEADGLALEVAAKIKTIREGRK